MSGLDDTSYTVRSVTANATVNQNDYFVLCDPSGGAITVTLPAISATIPGRVFQFRTTGTTNAVTISRAGSDTIDGGTTVTLASGAIHGKTILTDGTAWYTVDGF